jgi:hypothetical protein
VNLSASRDGIGSTILDDCRKNNPDVLVMGRWAMPDFGKISSAVSRATSFAT